MQVSIVENITTDYELNLLGKIKSNHDILEVASQNHSLKESPENITKLRQSQYLQKEEEIKESKISQKCKPKPKTMLSASDIDHNLHVDSLIYENSTTIGKNLIKQDNRYQDNHQNQQRGRQGNQSNRFPMFLSLMAKDTDDFNCKTEVFSTTIDVLEKLVLQFPDDTKLSNDLWEIRSKELKGWKLPQSFHVTTLYVGRSKKNYYDKEENILGFKERVNFPFSICGLAYIPGGILTGITFPDRKKVDIDNKFPHMTMMTCNNWAPVMSNTLLTKMFDKGNSLEKYYSAKSIMGLDSACRTDIVINEQKHNAYLIPLTKVMLIHASTKTFY